MVPDGTISNTKYKKAPEEPKKPQQHLNGISIPNAPGNALLIPNAPGNAPTERRFFGTHWQEAKKIDKGRKMYTHKNAPPSRRSGIQLCTYKG